MIIAVDLDSTLNTLDQNWLDLYNRDYQDTMTPDDILTWDTHKYVKPVCGKRIYAYLNEPSLYAGCAVKPGAQGVVADLYERGHEVIVVSSCATGSYDAKKAWLKEHFPLIPADNFIACHRKELIIATALIDDGYHNLVNFEGYRILFKAPWNVAQYEERGELDDIDFLADGWAGVRYYLQEIGAL